MVMNPEDVVPKPAVVLLARPLLCQMAGVGCMVVCHQERLKATKTHGNMGCTRGKQLKGERKPLHCSKTLETLLTKRFANDFGNSISLSLAQHQEYVVRELIAGSERKT